MSQVIFQFFKLSYPALGTKLLKSSESRARSRSQCFTGKSEQTFSQWNPRKEGRRFHGVTFSNCSWRNPLW